jgi:hypothetical protein
MKFKKSDLLSAILHGADWLVDCAQDKDHRSPTFGALRNGYWIGLGRWDWFEPVWHTGQAALALLIAHRLSGRKRYRDAAIRGGEYILRQQIIAPNDPVRHGHIRGYIKPDEPVSNTSTFLESLVGLLKLHAVTGEARWLDAVREALDWTVRNAWLEKEGLILDCFDWQAGRFVRPNPDCKRLFTPAQIRKLGIQASARPLLDDSMFLRGWQATGEEKYLHAFRSIADRLVRDQDRWGNWIGYIPCDPFAGRFHARQAWWWGYPLLDAYREFGQQKYLRAAARAADWYVRVLQRDGSMCYSNFTDGRMSSMLAICGSATACAALLFHDLVHDFGRQEYREPLERCVAFLLTTQHGEQFPDKHARGAFFEAWGAKPGMGAHVYQVRDIATSFAIRALAKLL